MRSPSPHCIEFPHTTPGSAMARWKRGPTLAAKRKGPIGKPTARVACTAPGSPSHRSSGPVATS